MWKPTSGTITSPAGVAASESEEIIEITASMAPRRRSPATSNSVLPSQSPIMKPIAASSPTISRTSMNASNRRTSARRRSMNCPVSGA
jgi:hypothetical protein